MPVAIGASPVRDIRQVLLKIRLICRPLSGHTGRQHICERSYVRCAAEKFGIASGRVFVLALPTVLVSAPHIGVAVNDRRFANPPAGQVASGARRDLGACASRDAVKRLKAQRAGAEARVGRRGGAQVYASRHVHRWAHGVAIPVRSGPRGQRVGASRRAEATDRERPALAGRGQLGREDWIERAPARYVGAGTATLATTRKSTNGGNSETSDCRDICDLVEGVLLLAVFFGLLLLKGLTAPNDIGCHELADYRRKEVGGLSADLIGFDLLARDDDAAGINHRCRLARYDCASGSSASGSSADVKRRLGGNNNRRVIAGLIIALLRGFRVAHVRRLKLRDAAGVEYGGGKGTQTAGDCGSQRRVDGIARTLDKDFSCHRCGRKTAKRAAQTGKRGGHKLWNNGSGNVETGVYGVTHYVSCSRAFC